MFVQSTIDWQTESEWLPSRTPSRCRSPGVCVGPHVQPLLSWVTLKHQ